MTFLEAAQKVLSEHGKDGPLHTRDIARLALEQGFLQSQGQTPDATMAAQLYMAVKQDAEAGREPRFVQVGKGLFALASGVARRGVEGDIAAANKQTRSALLEQLGSMSPSAFEHLLSPLLTAIGYEDVSITGRSRDGGIDALGRLSVGGVTDVSTAIQAKRWKANVPGKVIRELRGSLQVDQRGLVITTSGYTKEALVEAKASGKQPISLVDGEKLVDLLVKYQLGVSKKSVEILQLNLEALREAEEESHNQVVTGKAVVVWPLPGGKEAYYDTLLTFLRHISVSQPDDAQMFTWVKTHFPQVESESVAGGYIRVLRSFGLVQYDGETIVLTPEGIDFLSDPSRPRLLELLKIKVLGIEEIVSLLQEGPRSKEAINQHLVEELHLAWETATQTSYRLAWLENLNAIEGIQGQFQLRSPSAQDA